MCWGERGKEGEEGGRGVAEDSDAKMSKLEKLKCPEVSKGLSRHLQCLEISRGNRHLWC